MRTPNSPKSEVDDVPPTPRPAFATIVEMSAPVEAMPPAFKAEPLKRVRISALALTAIQKRCSEKYPSVVTGFVIGMDNGGTLEVTNAFNFPPPEMSADMQYEQQLINAAAAAPRAKSNTAYQNEYIRMIKESGQDANCVGWFVSANLGNFVNENFIQNQYYYQKELNETTCALVYDTARSSTGTTSIKAYRINSKFMAQYKENKFTMESLGKSGLKASDILEELPISVHNSFAVNSFLNTIPKMMKEGTLKMPRSIEEVEENPAIKHDPLGKDFSKLSLSIDPLLSQTADNLLDSVETHHVESNNFSYYSRAMAREQAKIAQWQAKRKAENAARALQKQPPLPEDEWQRLFKLPTEPSRLESMLNSRQVEQYARQTDGFVAGTTGKMFAIRGNLIPGDGSIPKDEE